MASANNDTERPAISDVAWRNVHVIISAFDNFRGKYGGVVFDIDPFRDFWPKEFAYKLTPGRAKTLLHTGLRKWGKIARKEDLFEFIEVHLKSEDGLSVERHIRAQPKSHSSQSEVEFIEALQRGDVDPNREAIPNQDKNPNRDWWFIAGAYWNLCSLVTHRQTIEELICQAAGYKKDETRVKGGRIIRVPGKRKNGIAAVRKLLAISNSFLLAEWMQEFVFKATANKDEEFFQAYIQGIESEIPEDRKDTVQRWLAPILLWYLGGSEIRPRRKFQELLQQRRMVSGTVHLTDEIFRAMLSSFGLTKK